MTVNGADTPGRLRELKVSGHTMFLDPGLYCVFHEASATPVGGSLPAVRVTRAPGQEHDLVAIASLGEDGWLGSVDAALIRVTGTGAEVLVTVYQEPLATAAPPKLQVLRLSGGVAVPDVPAPAAPTELLAHVYGRGDVPGQIGTWLGEPGSSRWIEGFAIASAGAVPPGDVEYQAVLGRGWLSPWSAGGEYCGSRGMSLPILGLRVRLRGASAASHQIRLWARFVDGTELGPVSGDSVLEAPSAAALEAFRLLLDPAGDRPAEVSARPPRRR